ncbi:hypothetical protein CHS0354_033655 [Potamilus streckersoni]|uniref:Glucose-methanol-choline oxidoreductase C-terminal domain-containing protein n=1 Tax=Potamilus streckersoni TaxID=2493646 RepID=A0AAE0S1X9_9BIVA|nr:hypothetical protein CHS0354_033655 [Potamilus streckersoni]
MTKPMLALNATFRNKPFSGCTSFGFDTDQYWECIIRHFTVTIYHPTTTCKMGAVTDPSTVVDPSLRVKGISSLRVIDASIMPDAISGNTMSASIMIGEKGADLVRNIDSVNQLRKKRK